MERTISARLCPDGPGRTLALPLRNVTYQPIPSASASAAAMQTPAWSGPMTLYLIASPLVRPERPIDRIDGQSPIEAEQISYRHGPGMSIRKDDIDLAAVAEVALIPLTNMTPRRTRRIEGLERRPVVVDPLSAESERLSLRAGPRSAQPAIPVTCVPDHRVFGRPRDRSLRVPSHVEGVGSGEILA